MPTLEPHIRMLLAEVSGVDPALIRESIPLVEYGLDSVRAMDLIVRIEDDFGIHIPDEALLDLRTLGDVIAYVRVRSAA
jgi:acyl carrier protein